MIPSRRAPTKIVPVSRVTDITEDYVQHWSQQQAVDEYFQNWQDAVDKCVRDVGLDPSTLDIVEEMFARQLRKHKEKNLDKREGPGHAEAAAILADEAFDVEDEPPAEA